MRETGGPHPGESLAVQAHALRALAGLIERVGIPGLHLVIEPDDLTPEIAIQVPEYLGSPAERAAMTARLAIAVGGSAARTERPGHTHGWIRATGKVDGHNVRIFTAIDDEEDAQ